MSGLSNSIAYVQAGSHRYPLITERRCRTCTHPERIRVETEVVQGRPWSAILRDLPGESGLSARGIRNHFVRGHLPIEEETVARLVQRQAEERGHVVAAGADSMVGHVDFASSVLGRVSHLLLTGQATPTIRDGLAAAALMAKLELTQPAFSEEDFVRASFVFLDAAEEVLPHDMSQAVFERVNSHPATQELSRRWEQLHSNAPRFKFSGADGSVAA
jgi:hypothetical protein